MQIGTPSAKRDSLVIGTLVRAIFLSLSYPNMMT